jgi:hypothetical protein
MNQENAFFYFGIGKKKGPKTHSNGGQQPHDQHDCQAEKSASHVVFLEWIGLPGQTG